MTTKHGIIYSMLSIDVINGILKTSHLMWVKF